MSDTCGCGCGETPPVARQTDSRKEHIKGQRIRFVNGHHGRVTFLQDETERFWGKVDKEGSCWLWTGGTRQGYGLFRLKGKGPWVAAHRYAYEQLVSPIPEGLVVDHLCRTPACVNPAHMDLVTPRENTARGMAPTAILHRQNRCAKGHSLADSANVYTPPGTTRRQCRACRRARWAAWKAAK